MDFIYEVENNLSKELCDEMIRRYKNDNLKKDGVLGYGDNNTVDKTVRSSTIVVLRENSEWSDIDKILYQKLQEGLKKYIKYLTTFISIRGQTVENLFTKDEGYHIQEMKSGDFYDWHYDDGPQQNRMITAIWYLNTLEEYEGGTTDFWCGKRVRPKQGTLLFFPSSWSYFHRGAPVKNSATKYTCMTWLIRV